MASINPDDLARVQAALGGRRKIEAIKIYREATGLGLKESKEAVERMERESQSTTSRADGGSDPATGHGPVKSSSGCGSVVLLGVGLLLWVVWL